jgi:DNA mismatch repair protein MutS
VVELERLGPAELLVPRGLDSPSVGAPRTVTRLADEQVAPENTRTVLLSHFGVTSLEAYGCEDRPFAAQAAGAILVYLRDTQPDALANLTGLRSYRTDNFMWLDPQAIRNLEVFRGEDFTGGAAAGSLVATIDLTVTPMGGRRLRRWLRHPLLDTSELRARQDAVEWFYKRPAARDRVRAMLADVLDVERLLGRIRRRLAVPAEPVALARSLKAVPQIRLALESQRAPSHLAAPLESCEDLTEYIERAISDRPPSDFERGGILRTGFSPELDELRGTLSGSRRFLAEFEQRERQRTGIRSIKVGYNKVFGYYIEVTKPNLRLAPNEYIRKQTLTNAERFFTLELKEHESLIANARERLQELETSLYRQVCDEISRHHERIRRIAEGLALIDLFTTLAECAARFGYVRPELNGSNEVVIVRGRHPVIEHELDGRTFQPNDTHLSNSGTQIMLLTAPNMAGKSVYLRQVALICLLAQIGSFVPAERASLGLIDRIFTRVGLHDHALRGHSSFMVEMIETAHILHHATPHSLILLDEIGRGTSTADGLSIARSVVEYLHNQPRLAAKTLFATHYHELTACADCLPRVRNFHLAVRECDHRVHYLHRVEPGRAEKSFGLHVAQLAGLPKPVIHRAQELLNVYDSSRNDHRRSKIRETPATAFAEIIALFKTLINVDINELSPVEALTQLYDLQRRAVELQGKG